MNPFVPAAYLVKNSLFSRGYVVSNPKNESYTQNVIKCHLAENMNNRITLYKQHAAILAECNKPDVVALQEKSRVS
jgi:hypothetical protein